MFIFSTHADLTGSDIGKVGIYSAIPTIINIFSVPSIGFVLDHLNNIGRWTTTQVDQKISNSSS